MRGSIIKRCLIVLISLFVASSLTISYAHSGRTDANGGHRDNKNKSGLGSYHYHCGGYPPHLHENGYCPYEYSEDSFHIEEWENMYEVDEELNQIDNEIIEEKEDTEEINIIENGEQHIESKEEMLNIIIQLKDHLFGRIFKIFGI